MNFIVAPFVYAKQKWSFWTGDPKRSVQVFLSDPLYIWDHSLSVFNPVEILLCGLSDVVTTWNHTIVSYMQAEIYSSVPMAFSSKGKCRADPGIKLVVSFMSMITSSTVLKTCACVDEIPGYKKIQKLEPVSSTSRRGARAAYHDEYPRDFGPRIAYTVS